MIPSTFLILHNLSNCDELDKRETKILLGYMWMPQTSTFTWLAASIPTLFYIDRNTFYFDTIAMTR